MANQKYYHNRYPPQKKLHKTIPKTHVRDYYYTRLPPRRCLLEPVPEIYYAQDLLSEAVECKDDQHKIAMKLIWKANLPEIAVWAKLIWGEFSPDIHRIRTEKPDLLPEKEQDKKVDLILLKKLIKRDGYHCRWCGIPVIPNSVREHLAKKYPDALRWGKDSNNQQHAAFQAMQLVADHVKPLSRGGQTSLENLVISCAPCNSGRWYYLPEEMALIDPSKEKGPWVKSDWKGLTRVIGKCF